jgi:uncharacterized protein
VTASPFRTEDQLRARLAPDLHAAIKARDGPRVAALRSLIAALDNATAVELGSPRGQRLGDSAEVPRKWLSDEDVRTVLAREMDERRDAALALEKHGCYEEAALVRAELEIIEGYAACACGSGAATP